MTPVHVLLARLSHTLETVDLYLAAADVEPARDALTRARDTVADIQRRVP